MEQDKKTKKKINNLGGSGSGSEESNKKERHIVTWTPEEDATLRQQISLHGTDNWAIIASKFNDKTTRQCRRRWYTYLNSDFKNGGWSQEEDLLLCEAQRVFGNRWTEIAKVVSGRTDNAVKNRFTTLCKKRAKHEALAKENDSVLKSTNKKRVMLDDKVNNDGIPENSVAAKRARRTHLPDQIENHIFGDRSHPKPRTQQPRSPLMVLPSDVHKVNTASLLPVNCAKDNSSEGRSGKTRGTFLKKDNPKISALMQQAELMSTLASKVNAENTDLSLEHAWKVLQDFLKRGKEHEIPGYAFSDIDFQLEEFKDLIEDSRSSSEGSRPSWRQPNLYEESPASSEFSTGSSLMPYPAPNETQGEIDMIHKDIGNDSQRVHIAGIGECGREISGENMAEGDLFHSFDEQTNEDTVVSCSSSTEFGSPRQVTPIFRSMAAGIPSPHFSESERRFLLKTLGGESSFPNPTTNTSQPPPCKRILLQSL